MTDALASGIASDELDPGIRPQDDLFRHVNARWLERTEIPSDRARWGSFLVLHEQAEAAVREIIEAARDADPGTEERKIGDLYTSFLDTAAVDARGAEPIRERLEAAAAVTDVPGLLRFVGSLEREGFSGLAGLYVDNDPGDPETYRVIIAQGGISLPDESYYREERFAETRASYVDHVERMLVLAGLDDARARAERVLELETAVAAGHWDAVASRDSEKTYNPMSWDDALGLAGEADLDVWRVAMGAPEHAFEKVIVAQPDFVTALGGLLTDELMPAWRDWLAWKIVHGAAPYLSTPFVEENFDFYGRTLTGTPTMRERWKRGVSLVEGALGEAIGRLYVASHFPPASKTAMDALVADLVAAYRDSISHLDWMTDGTRERALEKLAKFTPKIGYPVRWRDYSAMTIVADDLMANVRAASAFEFDRELAKLGSPLDRDEWFMTPQTINAYYNPGFNEIVFPAAILQYPFFTPDRDAAANYGAIGAVIGHEIGHGFDDQGSKFDGDGRLTDWWTPEDRAAFEERTRALIAQYDALAPAQVPDHHVNGALTVGENIGDLGGLAIAWKAYLISLDGALPPVIDGMTGAERFFLSWAQAWQQKSRDAEVVRLLAIDPHSPNEFRCNQIVRNIDEFYDTFGLTASDALWLDVDERVRIW